MMTAPDASHTDAKGEPEAGAENPRCDLPLPLCSDAKDAVKKVVDRA